MSKITGYDRFLDIHIMHNGAYDFVEDVASQIVYQRRRWGFPTTLNLTPWEGGKDDNLANGFDFRGIDVLIFVWKRLLRVHNFPSRHPNRVAASTSAARHGGDERV